MKKTSVKDLKIGDRLIFSHYGDPPPTYTFYSESVKIFLFSRVTNDIHYNC